MARIVRRKRRRLTFEGFAVLTFTFSLVVFLISSLFINTMNNSLSVKVQKLNDELTVLSAENEDLTFTISSLENKDYVYSIAQANNLSLNQENIISITGE